MALSIIACVLAVIVPLVVGAVLLTSLRSVLTNMDMRRANEFSLTAANYQTSLTRLEGQVATLAQQLQGTTGAHLAAELAALDGDVQALAKSVKKNVGRLWAELHVDGTLDRNKSRQKDLNGADDDEDLDPDLAAMLALQRAEPARKPRE